jgi:hypothetical protein
MTIELRGFMSWREERIKYENQEKGITISSEIINQIFVPGARFTKLF